MAVIEKSFWVWVRICLSVYRTTKLTPHSKSFSYRQRLSIHLAHKQDKNNTTARTLAKASKHCRAMSQCLFTDFLKETFGARINMGIPSVPYISRWISESRFLRLASRDCQKKLYSSYLLFSSDRQSSPLNPPSFVPSYWIIQPSGSCNKLNWRKKIYWNKGLFL